MSNDDIQIGSACRPESGSSARFTLIGAAPTLPAKIPSLDGLRALSIVLVLIAHAAGTHKAPGILDQLVPLGNLGVKVFFVISGFLITTLLLREFAEAGQVSLRNFYGRRAIRIFPAFYAYVAVIVVIHCVGLIPMSDRDLIHALTYTANYNTHTMTTNFDPGHEWYLNHLWSLAVEEQFYLLWPITLVLVWPRRATWIVAGTIVSVPLIRLAMAQLSPPLPDAAYTRQFQAVADALAAGCLLALIYNWLGSWSLYLKVVSSRWFFVIAGSGIFAALMLFKIDKAYYYVWGQSLVNVIIAIGIDRAVRFPDTLFGRLLNLGPVKFLGVISYSLYLWQEPFLNPFADASFHTTFPWNIGLALAAAVASYYLIEKPFLKLRHYFANRQGNASERMLPEDFGAAPSDRSPTAACAAGTATR